MSIQFMSLFRGLRYPTAFAFGLLLTGAIFWSLWSFTNVTFQIPTVTSVPIEWTRLLEDTPPQTKYDDEVIKKPPVVRPVDTVIIDDFTPTIGPVLIEQTIETPAISGPVPAYAPDRDVAALVRISPEYPARARAQGIEGWVKVQYTITGTGAVTNVVVVANSPSNVFDDAAVKAVSRWRYSPKVESAVAVERVGVQTILRFSLEE